MGAARAHHYGRADRSPKRHPNESRGIMKRSCICILAHNEEAQLADTLRSLRRCSGANQMPTIVYANGCTDRTVGVVGALSQTMELIDVVELAIASKVNAWNRAFRESDTDYVVFSDGDIEAEEDAIEKLLGALDENPEAVIAACRFSPKRGKSVTRESKIVGFLQQPLVFDYLCGGLYAVNRAALDRVFREHSIDGIPQGVTGEDEFLDMLLSRRQLLIVDTRFFYAAPGLDDFCKVLARFDWQARQLATHYAVFAHPEKKAKNRLIRRLLKKLSSGGVSWWPGLPAVGLRYLFRAVYARRIADYLRTFGAIEPDGAKVLSSQSRTGSGRS